MKKPVIGIVARVSEPDSLNSLIIEEKYRQVVIQYGAIPFLILPPQLVNYNEIKVKDNKVLTDQEKQDLRTMLNICDGIIMPGGHKMFEYDFFVLDYAIKHDIPILGICLGMQVMANYKKEILNEKNEEAGINHYQDKDYVHSVTINKNSHLYKILGSEQIKVNSHHHYHVLPSHIYTISAKSEDGLIEAIELNTNTFNIGVQWHPESMVKSMVKYDEYADKLFNEFIYVCKKKQRSKLKDNRIKI